MAPQQSAGFHSFGLEFGKRLNSSLGLAHLSKMGLPAANCVPDFPYKSSITGWGRPAVSGSVQNFSHI